jgi:hypothetical protein
MEMEQAHLGVGDLGDRVAVDPDHLQQGNQRQPRLQASGGVAQKLDILLAQRSVGVQVETRRGDDPLRQGRLQASFAGRVHDLVGMAGGGEQLLGVGIGEPPVVQGTTDLGEAVAARTQPRDHAGVADSGRGPAILAVVLRQEASRNPPPQGGAARADPVGDLALRQPFAVRPVNA